MAQTGQTPAIRSSKLQHTWTRTSSLQEDDLAAISTSCQSHKLSLTANIIMEDAPNPLISTQKSDSDLQVSLHPMVLLTISDHITRHHARQQPGPIVGALLGRQKEERREITLEHAFECHLLPGEGSGASLHQAWFDERLKQCRKPVQSFFSHVSTNGID
jgi:hypothetical protein